MATPNGNSSGSNFRSYREMLQTMKKFQTTLDNLQDQAVTLQLKFAEANFRCATLFHPDVAAIVIKSEKGAPVMRTDSDAQGNDEEKSKELNNNFENMCEDMANRANNKTTQEQTHA